MGDVLLRRPRIKVGQPLDPLAAAGTTTDTGPDAPHISTPPSRKYPSPRLPRPSRRDFIKRCGTTAPLPGVGMTGIPRIAKVLEQAAAKRPSVVWLNFASDTGCTEALIKASDPNAARLILEILSLNYNETIMAYS